METREKFVAFADQLKARFVDREAIIEGMVCAAVAGEHVLLLGPPGTAKSALANAFTAGVQGASCFSWLLSKFTAPEEIWGPISLKGIREDQYKRVTTGKLPEAHVAFLDEIFKSSSSILNMLLTAINERRFYNSGTPTQIPLRFVVGASNELPEGPELAALYDRFLVRYWVDYLKMPGDFARMLKAPEPSMAEPAITLAEWTKATKEAMALPVAERTYESLFKVKTLLGKESISVSDRRWKRCLRLLQANAWLSGDKEVGQGCLAVLSDALWDNPEQREAVALVVGKVSVSPETEALAMLAQAEALFDSLPAADEAMDREVQEKYLSASREGKRVANKMGEVKAKCGTADAARVQRVIDSLEGRLRPIRDRIREGLGL